MISVILSAAISCTALLPAGSHSLECNVLYLHTLPDGTRYETTKTHTFWTPVPMDAKCTGEGRPERVILKDNGVVVCGDEVGIFRDGFESGDTGEWK